MLPDSPIKSSQEDLLRRAPLAKKISSLITQYTGHESFVIGIDGVWGSGKTSFVNLITEHLITDKNVLLIEFNPWNFSDQNELIREFFNALSVHLKGHVTDHKSAIRKISEYASKLTKGSEFSFEPEVSLMGIIKLKAGKIRRSIGSKTLEEHRKSVDELIKSMNKKVVVCIDDTDRLDTDETKLILKLVKITANFPNTIFLLAYDRSKVADRINETGLPGEEYLKKIVQVNFRLPMPEQQDLHRILFRDIDSVIQDIEEKRWEANRWRSLFHSGFKDFFKTIRDIKRYIGSLSLDFSIVGKDEVNPIDFLGIEMVRVFAPDVYTSIGDNKELFTGTASFWRGTDQEKRENAIDKILDSYSDSTLRDSLKKIVRELFPLISGGYSSEEWRKALRVAAPEIFGRYFQMGTPTGTVSEETIRVLMTTPSEAQELTENLEIQQRDGKLRNVLIRALDYLGDLGEDRKRTLLISLLSFGDVVKAERLGFHDFEDEDNLILRLIYFVLLSLPLEKRGVLLKQTIEVSSTVFTGAHVVAMLVDENQKRKARGSSDELLIDEAELSELKAMCIQHFKNAASNNVLLTSKRLQFILFRWKEWGSAEEVKSFIQQCLSTKKALVMLLTGFISEVISSSGNYNIINKEAIGELYDIKDIEDKVRGITDDDLAHMDEREKEAVQLFRNPLRNRPFS